MAGDKARGDVLTNGDIKMATAEDLKSLPGHTRDVLQGRVVISVTHKGYEGVYQLPSDKGITRPVDLHTYETKTADGKTVYTSVGYKDQRREALNASMSLSFGTGMHNPNLEEWVYDYDGVGTVEVTFPDGKKQTLELNEEMTLQALLDTIKASMPPRDPVVLEEKKFATVE